MYPEYELFKGPRARTQIQEPLRFQVPQRSPESQYRLERDWIPKQHSSLGLSAQIQLYLVRSQPRNRPVQALVCDGEDPTEVKHVIPQYWQQPLSPHQPVERIQTHFSNTKPQCPVEDLAEGAGRTLCPYVQQLVCQPPADRGLVGFCRLWQALPGDFGPFIFRFSQFTSKNEKQFLTPCSYCFTSI